jgi:hypothetical protein
MPSSVQLDRPKSATWPRGARGGGGGTPGAAGRMRHAALGIQHTRTARGTQHTASTSSKRQAPCSTYEQRGAGSTREQRRRAARGGEMKHTQEACCNRRAAQGTHLHVMLLVQQQVLWLEVPALGAGGGTRMRESASHRQPAIHTRAGGHAPVHHVVVVAVLHARHDLLEQVARLRLGQLHGDALEWVGGEGGGGMSGVRRSQSASPRAPAPRAREWWRRTLPFCTM